MFAGAACAVLVYHALPWSWVVWGLWLIGGAIGLWVVYQTAQVALTIRRLRQPSPTLPRVAPRACPACGGTEHEYKAQGLWDGFDRNTGRTTGGGYSYGVCKRCGSRWAQWDDDAPYVPSDDEWEREVELREVALRERERLR